MTRTALEPTGTSIAIRIPESVLALWGDSTRFSLYAEDAHLIIRPEPAGPWEFPHGLPLILVDPKTVDGKWDHDAYARAPAGGFDHDAREYHLFPERAS